MIAAQAAEGDDRQRRRGRVNDVVATLRVDRKGAVAVVSNHKILSDGQWQLQGPADRQHISNVGDDVTSSNHFRRHGIVEDLDLLSSQRAVRGRGAVDGDGVLEDQRTFTDVGIDILGRQDRARSHGDVVVLQRHQDAVAVDHSIFGPRCESWGKRIVRVDVHAGAEVGDDSPRLPVHFQPTPRQFAVSECALQGRRGRADADQIARQNVVGFVACVDERPCLIRRLVVRRVRIVGPSVRAEHGQGVVAPTEINIDDFQVVVVDPAWQLLIANHQVGPHAKARQPVVRQHTTIVGRAVPVVHKQHVDLRQLVNEQVGAFGSDREALDFRLGLTRLELERFIHGQPSAGLGDAGHRVSAVCRSVLVHEDELIRLTSDRHHVKRAAIQLRHSLDIVDENPRVDLVVVRHVERHDDRIGLRRRGDVQIRIDFRDCRRCNVRERPMSRAILTNQLHLCGADNVDCESTVVELHHTADIGHEDFFIVLQLMRHIECQHDWNGLSRRGDRQGASRFHRSPDALNLAELGNRGVRQVFGRVDVRDFHGLADEIRDGAQFFERRRADNLGQIRGQHIDLRAVDRHDLADAGLDVGLAYQQHRVAQVQRALAPAALDKHGAQDAAQHVRTRREDLGVSTVDQAVVDGLNCNHDRITPVARAERGFQVAVGQLLNARIRTVDRNLLVGVLRDAARS